MPETDLVPLEDDYPQFTARSQADWDGKPWAWEVEVLRRNGNVRHQQVRQRDADGERLTSEQYLQKYDPAWLAERKAEMAAEQAKREASDATRTEQIRRSSAGGSAGPRSRKLLTTDQVLREFRPHRTMVSVGLKAAAMAAGGAVAAVSITTVLPAYLPAARPYVAGIFQPLASDPAGRAHAAAACLTLCAAAAIRTARRTPSAVLFAFLAAPAAALGWQFWRRSDWAGLVRTTDGWLFLGSAIVLAAIVLRGSMGVATPRLPWGARLGRAMLTTVAIAVVGGWAWGRITGRPVSPAYLLSGVRGR